MMLTGYPVEDLALRASFVEASIRTLHALAARLEAEGLGGVAVVTGYLDRRTDLAPRTGLPAGAPLDAAALLYGGRVVITSAKHHLPNYGVFDEFRYFVPGDTLPVFRLPAAGGAGPGGRPPQTPPRGHGPGGRPPQTPPVGKRAGNLYHPKHAGSFGMKKRLVGRDRRGGSAWPPGCRCSSCGWCGAAPTWPSGSGSRRCRRC